MPKYEVKLQAGITFYIAHNDMTPEQIFWYMDVKRDTIWSIRKIED